MVWVGRSAWFGLPEATPRPLRGCWPVANICCLIQNQPRNPQEWTLSGQGGISQLILNQADPAVALGTPPEATTLAPWKPHRQHWLDGYWKRITLIG